jgi:REP element-mobilizing transposase RayT
MREDVCRLRSVQCFEVLKHAFLAANGRIGFRLVHFSVQGNHVHLIAEAEGTRELSRGMQGLNVRMATALNRLMQRRGKVLADRYHAVILRTPTQTANAVHYVLHNQQHHAPGRYPAEWRDPFASEEAPLVAARTWLLDLAVRGYAPGAGDPDPAAAVPVPAARGPAGLAR